MIPVSQTGRLLHLGDMNESKIAIVIGGGPAGLAAAGGLAEGGTDTTLLEAGSGLGGRASTERRRVST